MTIRQIKHDGYGVVLLDFADMADLTSPSLVPEVNRARHADKLAEIERAAGRAWYGGIQGLAEARALFVDGWEEGARRAVEIVPQLSPDLLPRPVSIRRKLRWSDDGAELNLDRALAGSWENAWRSTTRAEVSAPRIVSVGCNFGGHADISHAQLFWCCAQMIVLADLLEGAGYQVELHALKCNNLQGAMFYMDCLVKRPGQPLRADAIASTFGHAGVYRSFGHLAICHSLHHVPAGLGMPLTNIAPHADALAEAHVIDRYDVVIDQAYTMQQAAAHIARALQTVAIPTA